MIFKCFRVREHLQVRIGLKNERSGQEWMTKRALKLASDRFPLCIASMLKIPVIQFYNDYVSLQPYKNAMQSQTD
jgi:hypothetical protein